VGHGVYQELKRHPEKFEIAGIAVRNLDRAEQDVDRELLSTDVFDVINRDCDVVVEAIGGCDPAAEAISAALTSGKHVVTANKAVLANHPQLLRLFARSASQLLFSAAVGGAVPVLEVARQLSVSPGIRSVEGVLNGTTNFILHELARGVPFDHALVLAQSGGLAEADPTADIDGSDVAAKLVLIAHCAFGAELSMNSVQRTGITEIDPRHVFDLSKSGNAVRLVGSLRKRDGVVIAEVKPVVLDSEHPFAHTHREENCVVIELVNGEQRILRGKGAGRWPTAEAVFADLLTLAAQHTTNLQIAEAVAS
jgi:homoserine dehydrogenase